MKFKQSVANSSQDIASNGYVIDNYLSIAYQLPDQLVSRYANKRNH